MREIVIATTEEKEVSVKELLWCQTSSYRPAVDAAHRAADGMCLLCRDVHRDMRLQDAGGQAESPWQMGEETQNDGFRKLTNHCRFG